MRWFTIDFNAMVDQFTPPKLSKFNEGLLSVKCALKPLADLFTQLTYKMQHDGTVLSIEKVMNDYFQVLGYNAQNHDATKTVYIENIVPSNRLYIFQDQENETSFLEDADSEDDIFIELDDENHFQHSWILFIPASYTFDEKKIAKFLEDYVYIGNNYKIQTY
jgi:hypothetical protein